MPCWKGTPLGAPRPPPVAAPRPASRAAGVTGPPLRIAAGVSGRRANEIVVATSSGLVHCTTISGGEVIEPGDERLARCLVTRHSGDEHLPFDRPLQFARRRDERSFGSHACRSTAGMAPGPLAVSVVIVRRTRVFQSLMFSGSLARRWTS